MSNSRKISESAVHRLSLYLRILEDLEREDRETVSSEEMSGRSATTAAQVRKDLSLFGSFGKRGLGYDVAELAVRLRKILGLDRRWRVALVGAGRIGSALVEYGGFAERSYDVVAIFDSDASKVGESWGGLRDISPGGAHPSVGCEYWRTRLTPTNIVKIFTRLRLVGKMGS